MQVGPGHLPGGPRTPDPFRAVPTPFSPSMSAHLPAHHVSLLTPHNTHESKGVKLTDNEGQWHRGRMRSRGGNLRCERKGGGEEGGG